MILDELVAATRRRVERERKEVTLKEYMELAYTMAEEEQFSGTYAFEKALQAPEIALICEVKKASPSKGIIAEDFDYLSIAAEYEEAGASAISVLTEPDYFKGDINYLQEISKKVKIPCLRKDFIVDPYLIYQAKAKGASCILLLCNVLNKEQLKAYIGICDQLHMSALVEIHDEEEGKIALDAGARIVGVNNRNLKDFTVDFNNSLRLRTKIPKEILFVAESGIKTATDMKQLYDAKVDAVLIGETLMRSQNKKAQVKELLSEI